MRSTSSAGSGASPFPSVRACSGVADAGVSDEMRPARDEAPATASMDFWGTEDSTDSRDIRDFPTAEYLGRDLDLARPPSTTSVLGVARERVAPTRLQGSKLHAIAIRISESRRVMSAASTSPITAMRNISPENGPCPAYTTKPAIFR